VSQQKPSSALPGIDAAPLTKDLILFNLSGKFSSQVAFCTPGQKELVVFLYLRTLLLIIPPKK